MISEAHVSPISGTQEAGAGLETQSVNSDTFHHTAIGIEEEDSKSFTGDGVESTKYLKMPNGYDVVAVRESLLSEAPFVSRGNKAFWRRMMDTPQFDQVLKCTYHHVLGCISDTGIVHEEKLVDIHESTLVESMSNNFADIYFGTSRHERDIFLPKVPELLCYMVLNALQAALPKHHRLYTSIHFREILIDWSAELFGGLRQSHPQTGREWFFAECSEGRLVTTNRPSKFTQALDATRNRAKSQYPLNSIGSSYALDHSPLIEMYIQRNNRSSKLVKNRLRVTWSHFPDRPLTNLQPGLMKSVRFRERMTDDSEIKQVMRRSNSMRRTIMTEFDVSTASYTRDMHRMKEALKTNLRVLSHVKVSRKKEYEAMAATANVGTISS